MSRDIFRHDTIEKLSSPTQLSKLLVVVRLRGWVVLFSLCAILVAIVAWSVLGQIPIITAGQGILLAPEAQFAIKSPSDGVVNQVFVKVEQEVTAGTPLMELNSGIKILAPHSGKVFQIDSGQGEAVKVGEVLLWFQTEVFPNQLEVYGFIPTQVGERIQVGMQVAVDLNAVDRQKYGQLMGKVKQVAPYAVSATSDQLKVIPSEKAREDLTKGATVELVIIQPSLDPNNKSGIRWSFGKGPPDRLSPGSTGTVRVTIENKRPISYLIPIVA
ncbi:HlyD family efflux transporter periplasmic adaptor subunit [Candidatus Neptunichlamydia sp. REUL1]|uniref:HlyD family efflux transporter periplasmic adaptor subunit n=1 Tax=Candidatus Neptunichlamydia sp. REUL1 TaxID=3064277 RepID=UPI00292EF50B|nr:HlyD family efflux transporter periplasmic adaptor subunit [Candidatus Neptunochlamydia sp. REUL1]